MTQFHVNHRKGGISARLIAHSVNLNPSGTVDESQEIATFELTYPRFIHSELMTHRVFSRNAASSRAIPVRRMIEMVKEDPAMPIHWGRNQPGMQAKEELSHNEQLAAKADWLKAAKNAAEVAESLNEKGVHKQIVNRILEPFQFMKTIVTSTELANWFWLRDHEDAQPEIKEVARAMVEVLLSSMPEPLKAGEWHTPYVGHMMDEDGDLRYYIDIDGETITLPLEQALRVSSSCCAQVSFRALDESLEKAEKIYSMLVESEPVHASPFEHQATPINPVDLVSEIPSGVTHVDKHSRLWSGNFKNFIQHRQLIPNNAKH